MKKTSIVGLIVIAVAIGVIICVYGSASTYGSFNDAQKSGETIQVTGKLDKQKELYYDATRDANYFSFYVTDNEGRECKVEFTGTKPQDFEKSETIVLTGQMRGNAFHAKSILMKCPSKYNNTKVETTFEAKNA